MDYIRDSNYLIFEKKRVFFFFFSVLEYFLLRLASYKCTFRYIFFSDSFGDNFRPDDRMKAIRGFIYIYKYIFVRL